MFFSFLPKYFGFSLSIIILPVIYIILIHVPSMLYSADTDRVAKQTTTIQNIPYTRHFPFAASRSKSPRRRSFIYFISL